MCIYTIYIFFDCIPRMKKTHQCAQFFQINMSMLITMMRTLLPFTFKCAGTILASFLSYYRSILSGPLEHGQYRIYSRHGCAKTSRSKYCNYTLAWDGGFPSQAVIEPSTSTSPLWEVKPLGYGNQYYIRNLGGCPSGALCNAALSYESTTSTVSKTFIKVFHNDIPWTIMPRNGNYRIQSAWQCPTMPALCKGELSWDTATKPKVTLEQHDSVDWAFVMVKKISKCIIDYVYSNVKILRNMAYRVITCNNVYMLVQMDITPFLHIIFHFMKRIC